MASTLEQTDGLRLDQALQALEGQGFLAVFKPVRGGRVLCTGCALESPAREMRVLAQHRIEGVSDPADEMLVVGLRCPGCDALGTMALAYGPRTLREEADVLRTLRPLRRPARSPVGRPEAEAEPAPATEAPAHQGP
jgi:hypothetical protein